MERLESHVRAPITNLGAKFCEYCGAGVMELNVHAWSFENIEEA